MIQKNLSSLLITAIALTSLNLHAAVSITNRLFFSPNGASPVGTHVLSAFKSDSGRENFYALESVKSAKTRSGKIFWAGSEVDLRGYGPSISSWAIRVKEGTKGVSGDLVTVNYQSRKNETMVALVNDGTGYMKRFKAFDTEKVLQAAKDKIKKKAEEMGIPAANLDIYGEWSYATRLDKKYVDGGQPDADGNYPFVWVNPEADYLGADLVRINYDTDKKYYENEQVAFRVGAEYYVSDTTDPNLTTELSASSLVVFTIDANQADNNKIVTVKIDEPIVSVPEDKVTMDKVAAKYGLKKEELKLPGESPKVVPADQAD